MNEASMQDLAARLARGDEAAFADLYDACADRLHRYLMARLGSREVAADVLQTAFLRAVKSRGRFSHGRESRRVPVRDCTQRGSAGSESKPTNYCASTAG